MNRVPKDLLEKWLKGWSISRGKPLPEAWKSGYRIQVGDKEQKERYIFPEVSGDFIQLSESIHEPWVYLKVCAPFEEFGTLIPERWKRQPQGYMMYCPERMTIRESNLPNGYSMEVFGQQPNSFIVRIYSEHKKEAAIGRIVIVDGLAVYDRIKTEQDHQRKGLATQIIRQLETIALSQKVSGHFLVATEQGKLLYESLGWKLYSLYSSIVIPEKD